MTNYKQYYELLRYELIPAYGCTEPSALAYAASCASSILGRMPDSIIVYCSSSVIKNVFSVDIPNAGNLKGPRAAVILGALVANPSLKLCILQNITQGSLKKALELFETNYCSVELEPDKKGLYIRVQAASGSDSSEVAIINEHTNIAYAKKNGVVLSEHELSEVKVPDRSFLNVKDIIEFASSCDISQIADILERQIECNSAISDTGLDGDFGIGIGKSLMKFYGDSDIRIRARAKAAAGSDARMAGCVMPVVINSGSGNQGITVSLPVITYAKEYNVPHEKLLRSLALANLIAILQKREVGNLSAFCGAVHAAAGAACGISFMLDGTYDDISNIISFTLGTAGGMLCDGAKASCAAKISLALDAAIMGMQLSKSHKFLKNGDGLVKSDIESTIDSFGKVGGDGMEETNRVVLSVMLDRCR